MYGLWNVCDVDGCFMLPHLVWVMLLLKGGGRLAGVIRLIVLQLSKCFTAGGCTVSAASPDQQQPLENKQTRLPKALQCNWCIRQAVDLHLTSTNMYCFPPD